MSEYEELWNQIFCAKEDLQSLKKFTAVHGENLLKALKHDSDKDEYPGHFIKKDGEKCKDQEDYYSNVSASYSISRNARGVFEGMICEARLEIAVNHEGKELGKCLIDYKISLGTTGCPKLHISCAGNTLVEDGFDLRWKDSDAEVLNAVTKKTLEALKKNPYLFLF